MSEIVLLDGSLKLRVFYDMEDRNYEDDICMSFTEDCAEDEKVFKADETNLYLTPEQAGLLVLELNRVLESYRQDTE